MNKRLVTKRISENNRKICMQNDQRMEFAQGAERENPCQERKNAEFAFQKMRKYIEENIWIGQILKNTERRIICVTFAEILLTSRIRIYAVPAKNILKNWQNKDTMITKAGEATIK